MKTHTTPNIVLLLTGTINPGPKVQTALTDKVQRKAEYVSTIRHYLSAYPFPIVFVENSKEDISSDFTEAIQNRRLEVFTFDGNDYPAGLGKGLGEFNCIKHGLTNAKLIGNDTYIIKITGRYKITNLQRFIDFYIQNPATELNADLTNNFQLSASGIFGFRKFFAEKFLYKNSFLLNDSLGWFFEHVLAKSVLEAIGDRINFKVFKYYPKIEATSGTTGKKYKRTFLYYLPRIVKYRIRYFIVNR